MENERVWAAKKLDEYNISKLKNNVFCKTVNTGKKANLEKIGI